jgi:hypothetical protein
LTYVNQSENNQSPMSLQGFLLGGVIGVCAGGIIGIAMERKKESRLQKQSDDLNEYVAAHISQKFLSNHFKMDKAVDPEDKLLSNAVELYLSPVLGSVRMFGKVRNTVKDVVMIFNDAQEYAVLMKPHSEYDKLDFSKDTDALQLVEAKVYADAIDYSQEMIQRELPVSIVNSISSTMKQNQDQVSKLEENVVSNRRHSPNDARLVQNLQGGHTDQVQQLMESLYGKS